MFYLLKALRSLMTETVTSMQSPSHNPKAVTDSKNWVQLSIELVTCSFVSVLPTQTNIRPTDRVANGPMTWILMLEPDLLQFFQEIVLKRRQYLTAWHVMAQCPECLIEMSKGSQLLLSRVSYYRTQLTSYGARHSLAQATFFPMLHNLVTARSNSSWKSARNAASCRHAL